MIKYYCDSCGAELGDLIHIDTGLTQSHIVMKIGLKKKVLILKILIYAVRPA